LGKKNFVERKMRGLISTATLSEIFHIMRRIQRDVVIRDVRRSSCKIPLVVIRFQKKKYLDIFEKSSNIKLHENPCIGSHVVPCGRSGTQTDRQIDGHDEANIHFLKFWELPKNCTFSPHTHCLYAFVLISQ
jgi:hypothetical protein